MVQNSFLTGIFTTVLITIINGSHFLGGSIMWRPQNASMTGSSVNIIITQTYSFAYASEPCTATMIANNQLFPAVIGSLVCASNCGSGAGGYTSRTATPYCTYGSSVTGITIGQRSDTVSLLAGSNFSVAFTGSAWRTLGAGGGSWSLASYINLKPRQDNGLYNNAPVSAMTSPIYIYFNRTVTITVPVRDADGDVIRCRWATSTGAVDECASVCPPASLPPNTVIYPNCTIVIGSQNVNNWYAIALMTEDFVDFSSTSPLSSVPVQFLVEFIAPPSCTILPEIIRSPIQQSCTPIKVNQTLTSQLIAVNYCGASVIISDINILSFPGMIASAIIMLNSTNFYKNLTWTPTSAQLGYQVLCATALNSQLSQSAQYCFTFFVATNNMCACPGDACETTTTTISTVTPLGTSTTLSPRVSTATNEKFNPTDNWPLIGSIIGVAIFASMILSCCLIWYCCCRRSAERHKSYKCQETIETCNSDTCTVHNAVSSKVSSILTRSSIISSVKSENGVDHTVIAKVTNSTNNALALPLSRRDKNLSLINCHDEKPVSLADKRIEENTLTDKSVSQVKTIEVINSLLHPKERPLNNAKSKDLSCDTHVNVSPIRSRKKRRSNSFHEDLRLRCAERSSQSTRTRRRSIGSVDLVRVIQVPMHSVTISLPPTDGIRPSILENTIWLNDLQETKQLSSAGQITKDHVRVQRIMSTRWQMMHESRISQVETIDPTPKLRLAKPADVAPSSSTVRVDRIMLPKRKLKFTVSGNPLKSISKNTKRDNGHMKLIESNVIVEFVPRENSTKP